MNCYLIHRTSMNMISEEMKRDTAKLAFLSVQLIFSLFIRFDKIGRDTISRSNLNIFHFSLLVGVSR